MNIFHIKNMQAGHSLSSMGCIFAPEKGLYKGVSRKACNRVGEK